MRAAIIRLACVALVSYVPGSMAVTAQSEAPATPKFEVASVKLHTSDDRRVMMVAQPGGRFVAANVPLKLVIRTAYQLQDDQIVGGPAWLGTDRFDIEARAPGMTSAPSIELLAMLRSLLLERFKLTTHREMRELPIFELARVRADGALGEGLRPTACPELAIDLSQPKPCANISNGSGTLTLRGMPVEQFAAYLAPVVNRVIVDRTALGGRWDIDLRWSPEQPQSTDVAGAATPARLDDPPSIFTALQEQLGLKLEASRGMVEVLVVDTLEHPSPN
jgi:uncharacterized protein (TIGR03435 family)